ncbi:hypothetical protein SAMN02745857_02083 [Andreprevotia lacus DSM 23236]|jgi:hypothetical protein|uniref:PilZ domain-containing protein n=1 Tax=Andreprevotia lacus DSM 23236 TaxID=1121001 RepID=A0A1W1XNY2_9NEIS|nr:hypothetical protein [Andreprevotia lacus]SMC25228.1 hypothetical protein SAMN02745857_02083 [Andreprevotia lacus DSM 23236]
MSEAFTTPNRKIVGWRAAIILNPATPPLLGRVVEASSNTLVLLADQEIRSGQTCRLFIDLPGGAEKRYLDCKIKITTATLMGQISRFKLIGQIVDLSDQQRDLLNRALG